MNCEQDSTPAQLNVRCRAPSGSIAVMSVLDLSAGGIMVRFAGWDARPGERVLTTIDGFSARPGVLVWVEDGRAGIAFAEALHEAVFDQLRRCLEGPHGESPAATSPRAESDGGTSRRRQFFA
ncbi:PilZ domain-containing protein [Aurantiacibacter flavus]|uniref:PilZ domain-containing protein n=1 Tax=Aurantiacibacter flavus TaxID=3145232 RepID=A0ABV0D1E9_9SPHN